MQVAAGRCRSFARSRSHITRHEACCRRCSSATPHRNLTTRAAAEGSKNVDGPSTSSNPTPGNADTERVPTSDSQPLPGGAAGGVDLSSIPPPPSPPAADAVPQVDLGRIPPPPAPPSPSPSPQKGLARRDIIGWVAVGTGLGALLAAGAVNQFGNAEARMYEQMRLESGFKREVDGHVWLRRKSGKWLEARTDAKMAGTVLLRDERGYIYYLGFNSIQQVDLTDDVVLAAVFGDGDWEQAMRRVQAKDVDGQTVDIQMDQDSFRNLISILA